MIRETELNVFVPSPELLVRLASGDRPLGFATGPPRIRVIRETYFDTPDQALRRRGMTCKMRQEEGREPDIVVTVGEGPDQEGITSRTRLTASAVGIGFFETLRGDSEPAAQVSKFVDPGTLRPQIALDIQRLSRIHRSGILRRPVLTLNFDRINVQLGARSSVFHEIRVRRRRSVGPRIRDLGQRLRDEHHLFPDGLSTLQRAYRILTVEKKTEDSNLSPYALSLVLVPFSRGRVGLLRRGGAFCVPSFRGSGEDAARALTADLGMTEDVELLRLGTTEFRSGRPVVELWAAPEASFGNDDEAARAREGMAWYPWYELLVRVGRPDLQDPNLLSALLLLTRRKMLGQLSWIPPYPGPAPRVPEAADSPPPPKTPEEESEAPDSEEPLPRQLERLDGLLPPLATLEDGDRSLAARLEGVSILHRELTSFFRDEVTRLKGLVLSGESSVPEPISSTRLLDLVSVRVRSMVDRMHQAFQEELLPELEARDVHLRRWVGLMHEDRRSLLEEFTERFLPQMEVGEEWGPAFTPEMPSAGCAAGVATWDPATSQARFFHVALAEDVPSFFRVPGSTMIVPLGEVVRGLVFRRHPELEQAETFLFRFLTEEGVVRRSVTRPPEEEEEEEGEGTEAGGDAGTENGPEGKGESPGRVEETEESREDRRETKEREEGPRKTKNEEGLRETEEFSETLVVRVSVERAMPESQQAQLLRALERQVTLKNPLVGWSDVYALPGPLDLEGLEGFPDLTTRKNETSRSR